MIASHDVIASLASVRYCTENGACENPRPPGRMEGSRSDFDKPMSRDEPQVDLLERAARAIRASEAIVIGAGAGMGVDSGLPDFRGGQGFWKAYPPYAELGLDFVLLANPRLFSTDPKLAWGFYGHRLM